MGVRREAIIHTETQIPQRQVIQSCPAPPTGCETRQSPYINSKRNRDTDSHTQKEIYRYRLSRREIVQSCLAPPPSGARDATANIHFKFKANSCRDIKHRIYKTSKSKLTPPLSALRKQLGSPQHSKVQRRLITPSVVLTQKQRIKSQDLKSCMVTLLLARTFYSIACSAFGECSVAFIEHSSHARSPPQVSRGHSFAAVHLSLCGIVQED